MKHSLYFVARAEGMPSGCTGPFFMIMKPTDDDDWIPQRGGGDDRSNGGTVIHPQSRG